MRHVNSKIVNIKNKLFTCVEKIPSANKSEDAIIILRNIELRTFSYPHPIKNSVIAKRYEKVSKSPKYFLKEEEWNDLPDQNVDQVGIDIQY